MRKVTKVSGSREIMYIAAFFAKQQLSRLSRYGHLNSCGKTSFVLNKQNHDKLSTAKVWTLRSGGSVGNLFPPCMINWISSLHLMKMLNVINFVCTSFQPRHHSSETRSRRVLLLTGRIQGLPRTFGHSHHGHAPRWTWSGLYNPPYGTLRTLANISELSIIYKSQKKLKK